MKLARPRREAIGPRDHTAEARAVRVDAARRTDLAFGELQDKVRVRALALL